MAVKFLTILLMVLISGCAKKSDAPQPLPAGFVRLLKRATTNDDILKLAKTIPLAPGDTTFVGNILYLYVTKDGRLATLDRANHTPLVFDSTGKFLGKIGNFGAGPGEFEKASAVCYDDSNQIWYVADNSLLRVSVFKNSGEYLRDFKIAAKMHELHISNAGELYFFMPNKREGEMIECVNAHGEKLASFFSANVISQPLFVLYAGGFCATRVGIFAAHYMSTDIRCFDYHGKMKFKAGLAGLTGYIPPPDPKSFRSSVDFMASFTGIMKILRGPFETIIILYQQRTAGRPNEQGGAAKVINYLAFLTTNGKVLASGLKSSVGYWTSDEQSRLYSVEYPESTANQAGNPVINVWTLKSF
jgi:hypothetical protein